MSKHTLDLKIMKYEREQLASYLHDAPTSVDMSATIQRIGFLNVAIADAERTLNAAPDMSRRHPLYQAAIDADEAFSAVITAVHGAKANRWSLPYPLDPRIEAAYGAKKSADWEWINFMKNNR